MCGLRKLAHDTSDIEAFAPPSRRQTVMSPSRDPHLARVILRTCAIVGSKPPQSARAAVQAHLDWPRWRRRRSPFWCCARCGRCFSANFGGHHCPPSRHRRARGDGGAAECAAERRGQPRSAPGPFPCGPAWPMRNLGRSARALCGRGCRLRRSAFEGSPACGGDADARWWLSSVDAECCTHGEAATFTCGGYLTCGRKANVSTTATCSGMRGACCLCSAERARAHTCAQLHRAGPGRPGRSDMHSSSVRCLLPSDVSSGRFFRLLLLRLVWCRAAFTLQTARACPYQRSLYAHTDDLRPVAHLVANHLTGDAGGSRIAPYGRASNCRPTSVLLYWRCACRRQAGGHVIGSEGSERMGPTGR